jgi:hypothetical protein
MECGVGRPRFTLNTNLLLFNHFYHPTRKFGRSATGRGLIVSAPRLWTQCLADYDASMKVTLS